VPRQEFIVGAAWFDVQVRPSAKSNTGQNTPTRVMGIKFGRTEDAVRAKIQEEGISLKPTNQSQYGTKEKK
jgi:hypothetical protein